MFNLVLLFNNIKLKFLIFYKKNVQIFIIGSKNFVFENIRSLGHNMLKLVLLIWSSIIIGYILLYYMYIKLCGHNKIVIYLPNIMLFEILIGTYCIFFNVGLL